MKSLISIFIFFISFNLVEAKTLTTKKIADGVCSYVNNLSKKGKLAENFIGQSKGYDLDELKSKFSEKSISTIQKEMFLEDGVTFVTETDFDADGVSDYILERSEGTAHCGDLALFHGGKNTSIEVIKIHYPDECLEASMISFELKKYLVITHNQNLSVRIYEKGKLVEKCDL